jgi:hypothetical protein
MKTFNIILFPQRSNAGNISQPTLRTSCQACQVLYFCYNCALTSLPVIRITDDRNSPCLEQFSGPMMMMFIRMGREYVSELWPLMGLLFIPQIIHESGDPWWNDNDRGKQKSEKNLSQCHFVHHKNSVQWIGLEPRPPWWEAGDCPLKQWHGLDQINAWINATELEGIIFCFIISQVMDKIPRYH